MQRADGGAPDVLDLADEMKLDVGEKMFVLNRATPEAAAALQPEIERLQLPLVATLPEDPGLFEAEVAGPLPARS